MFKKDSKLLKQVEPQIPNTFIADIHSFDRTRIIDDLCLSAMWQIIRSNEPFNYTEARRLRAEILEIRRERLKGSDKNIEKQREKTEKESVKLHREIAELVFGVEVLGEHSEVGIGELGWNSQIRDKITRKNVGTPRSLLNGLPMGFGWRTDTSATVDLQKYLSELKEKYDDFYYPFSFERARGFLSIDNERAHPTLTFRIRLFWRSLGVGSHARKKIYSLVSKYKK